MTDTLKKLHGGIAPNTLTTVYTAPALTKTVVREISVCNSSAAAATIRIDIGGQSIVWNKSIPTGDTLFLELFTVMEAADIIQIQAGTAAALGIKISGMEVA